MNTIRIESYSVCKPIAGLYKSYSIQAKMEGKNVSIPIMFLKKAKWIDEDMFVEIVNSISMNMPREIKLEEDE